MKWKFSLLNKTQLGLISLLSIVMGGTCKRTAPRYEPELPGYKEDIEKSTMDLSYIEEPSKSIANDSNPYNPLLNKLDEYSKDDVKHLLEDIDYNPKEELLILDVDPTTHQYLQNNFNAFIETNRAIVYNDDTNQSSRPTSNRLPSTLWIFFERNQPDGSWHKRRLVGTESITIRSNPVLPNSEKHSFALTAFLVNISVNNDSTHHSVAFVKSDQNWFFYNNDDTKTALSPKEAIRLASERGTAFFYKKIR